MHRILRNIAPLFVIVLTLAACTGGDEDPNMLAAAARAELQGAILGNLDRMNYYKDAAGNVKGEKMAVTGSNFRLRLDTLNKVVYNLDSLPVHTFMDSIYFATLAYVGTPYIQEADSTWALYDYNKPKDFSSPRKIAIKSTDGTKHVEYTFNICAHKENGDSMQWRHFADLALPSLSQMQLVAHHDSLYLWGMSGTTLLCCKAPDTLATKWIKTEVTTNTPLPGSIVKQGEQFCGLTATHIVASANGVDWQVLAERPENLEALVAGSTRCLYGITDQGFTRAQVADMVWRTEGTLPLEAMPATNLSAVCQSTASNPNVEEITLVGLDATGTAQIWRRNDMRDAKHEGTAVSFPWTYIEKDSSKYPMPLYSEFTIGYYDGGVLLGGVTAEEKYALSLSKDSGITWPTNAHIETPEITLAPRTEAQGSRVAMTISSAHHIWLYSNGQLWRGHLNRMLWK